MVIVSRQHCYETSRELPIAKVEEAIKAASNIDNVAPFKGETYFVVEKSTPEKCKVTFFVIQQDVFEHYSQAAWLLFPEAMLVKLALDKTTKSGFSHFEGKWQNRSLVAMSSESEFKSYIVEQGKPLPVYFHEQDKDVAPLSEQKYERFLLSAVFALKGYMVRQAFHTQRISAFNREIPWIQGGITAAAVGGIYLMLTSAYVHFRTESVTLRLNEQRTELNQVFAIKQQIDQEQQKLNDILNSERGLSLTSPVWEIVFNLLSQKDVNILSLRIESGDVFIRAKSKQATDILERLAGMETVSSPQITSPIVKSRGEEIITVKFNMHRVPAQQQVTEVVANVSN